MENGVDVELDVAVEYGCIAQSIVDCVSTVTRTVTVTSRWGDCNRSWDWPPLTWLFVALSLWLAAEFTRHSTPDIFPGLNSSVVGQLNGYQTDCGCIQAKDQAKICPEYSVNLVALQWTLNDIIYQFVNS